MDTSGLHVAAAAMGAIGAVALRAGALAGAFLRFVLARVSGTQPRSARPWAIELIGAAMFAVVVVVAFAGASDPRLVGPHLGAGLTTYAAAAAALGYLGARDADEAAPFAVGADALRGLLRRGPGRFVIAMLVATNAAR